jgi:hypothetical protein
MKIGELAVPTRGLLRLPVTKPAVRRHALTERGKMLTWGDERVRKMRGRGGETPMPGQDERRWRSSTGGGGMVAAAPAEAVRIGGGARTHRTAH